MLRVLLAVLLLAGCAAQTPTNVVTFDRTVFALEFGKMSVHLTDACAGKEPKLDKATCAHLRANAKFIEQRLLAPPAPNAPAIDMTEVMSLLGTFVGAAK